MYYLETNALYHARGILRDIGIRNDDLYTSWLAIFELLSGVQESTWGARKAALSLVAEFQLKIATSTPAEIIASSFEAIEFSAQKDRESILKLVQLALESENMEECNKMVEELEGVVNFEALRTQDAMISAHDELVGNGQRYRADNSKEARQLVRIAYAESESVETPLRYLEARMEYIRKTARMFASRLFEVDDERAIAAAEIEASYNGLCDEYFLAKAVLETEFLVNGISPRKNDNFDIAHLLYVGPNTLITNDKGLLALANTVRNGLAISVDELRSIMMAGTAEALKKKIGEMN